MGGALAALQGLLGLFREIDAGENAHAPEFLAAEAAIATHPSPWLPISAAKQDGTWYLLGVAGDDDPLRTAWHWERGDELTGGADGPWEGWMSEAGNPWEQDEEPTHCIPYPDHPGA